MVHDDDNWYATDFLIRWLLGDDKYFEAAAAQADTCSIDERYEPLADYILKIMDFPESEEARTAREDLSTGELAGIDWELVAEELLYKKNHPLGRRKP